MKKDKRGLDLIKAIRRSEMAFSLYSEHRLYFQALRIRKANLEVYRLLVEYLYQSSGELIEDVVDYIFHLEDWFEQFIDLEKSSPNLSDEFIFTRFPSSPSYPKDFIIKLSKIT